MGAGVGMGVAVGAGIGVADRVGMGVTVCVKVAVATGVRKIVTVGTFSGVESGVGWASEGTGPLRPVQTRRTRTRCRLVGRVS